MTWAAPRGKKLPIWIAGALGSALVTTLAYPEASWATLSSTAGVSAQQFAAQGGFGSRLDFTSALTSSESLPSNPRIPLKELRFYSFFETDSQGDHSFDLDQAVLRFPTGDSTHFWLGRVHPLNEGFETTRLSSTGAIGANWVQNQSNPLLPRVSGWVAAGGHYRDTVNGFFVTGSLTPLFFPSFGPAVQYSETSAASGPRFASLPPLYITINGQQLPLRYKIETGDLMKIVLQPQYFASVGQDTNLHRLTLMHWSAPSPGPQTSANGILRVNAQDADILVTAAPSFPRENFIGAQWSLKKALFTPVFEAAYETASQRVAVSGRLQLSSLFETGYLTTLEKQTIAPTGPSVSSPPYARNLFWAALSGEGLFRRVKPSLRLEQHFSDFQKDQWVHTRVGYVTDEKFTLFAAASVITGQDYSYFGTWRGLDSVSMGASYTW